MRTLNRCNCIIVIGMHPFLHPIHIIGNPCQEPDVWDKVLKVPDLCLRGVSEPTVINNDLDRMLVCSTKDGSHLVIHVYSHGLITLDIQHVEPPLTHKMLEERYSFKSIKELEENITNLLGKTLCQFSRSLPTVLKRGKVCPYFLRGNNTLFEYEPLQLVFEKESKWQNIKIYKTNSFGSILCLNEDLMIGESDVIYTSTLLGLERSNSYENKTVLILGGGDGGLLHELLKLSPRFVIMVEIDEDVINACREHMRGVCGDSLDRLNGPNYTILIDNCLKVLQDYNHQKVTFDYVINDLSEYLLDTETELEYDFKTSASILRLSMQILEQSGKYLSRGNCVTETEALSRFKEDVSALGLTSRSFITEVPSFMEKYCLFEVTMPTKDPLLNGEC